MATASITYVFANGTNADGTQVNSNFNAVLNFLNTEVVQRDASVAFTAIPSLPATSPTLDNHAVRKAYVDAFIPAGIITQFGGSSAPSGWLICDGSAVSRTNPTYSRLFAAIGTTYGVGDGATTFNIPNLKGRVPVGYDATQTEFDALAETGGAKTHALTTAQLPSHTHGVGTYSVSSHAGHTHANTFSLSTQANHNHSDGTLTVPSSGHHIHNWAENTSFQGWVWSSNTYNTGFTTNVGGSSGMAVATVDPINLNNTSSAHTHDVSGTTGDAGTHTHTISGSITSDGAHTHTLSGASLATGEGQAHNNLQPYLVVNHIIKL